MRVVEVTRFGGPEVLVTNQVPEPEAGPGQVVVRVAAADVLFVETQIRAGGFGEYFDVRPPYVPGGGVAGRVDAVGDGVDPGWLGKTVLTSTGGGGGYAERVVVGADGLVEVPAGVGAREAAALLHDGPTALELFEGNRVRAGEQVLIVGATGGAGILLVQLAHAAGARVVAAARGERKLALATELGADVVVDYSVPGWTDRVLEATGGTGPDLVLDGVGGEFGRAAFEVTPRGGRFSAHGAPTGGFAAIDPAEAAERGIGLRGIADLRFPPERARELAARALAEVAAGRIRPVIGQTFPLDRAADAHAAIEARQVIGKTLLLV
ncbi:zinc-binding dehydrogenase [Amycolatopsis anabasis]|uniref:zinc-binding dehydrogenase n=1 Tax=Amycolatopsis anabasis TaxID=1840409 RepID=UPI00131D645A|nr:zinc-binding dehydrogenase [Amycolatopsis anabasis]